MAERLDLPDIAGRELLGLHRRVYKTYWAWSDNRVNWSFRRNRQDTVLGWTLRFEERPKINSVRNFFMQGNGAEMLRLAACLATENGIQVCAPIHDAFLIMAPINRLQEDIRKMRTYMEEASSVILGGFRLRTDAHVFIHPRSLQRSQGTWRRDAQDRVEILMSENFLDSLRMPEQDVKAFFAERKAGGRASKRTSRLWCKFDYENQLELARKLRVPAIAVQAELYRQWYKLPGNDKSRPIALGNKIFRKLGFSHHDKFRALKHLEEMGFIEIAKRDRQTPSVVVFHF